MIAYRLSNTGHGSDKFGPCELCGKRTETTFLLTKYERFFSRHRNKDSLAYAGNAFGHKTCLSALTNQ